jgi:hypothetical protein
MEKNIGQIDRVLRILIGAVILWQGILMSNIILIALGSVLILTGLVGKCGIYKMLGVNTCRNCEVPAQKEEVKY